MDQDELFDAIFDGELRSEQVTDLREALERRVAQVQAARARGELVDADWADIETLSRQLAVLREEEIIARFIEDGLAASLRREEILRRLGEMQDE
ncbi:MAG: hypothetical protein HUU35_08890 [Armatimonadetes bacterium]|nr:hypothetical protein [Armatimonadota bacterium]